MKPAVAKETLTNAAQALTNAAQALTNAAQAYDAKVQEIQGLLKALQETVDTHKQNAKAAGINWCHVGDMTHLAQLLREAGWTY